jgi:hypothetical protein
MPPSNKVEKDKLAKHIASTCSSLYIKIYFHFVCCGKKITIQILRKKTIIEIGIK